MQFKLFKGRKGITYCIYKSSNKIINLLKRVKNMESCQGVNHSLI